MIRKLEYTRAPGFRLGALFHCSSLGFIFLIAAFVALAGLAVVGSLAGIFGGRNRQVRFLDTIDGLLMKFLQERHAPLATSASGQAFADLAGESRFLTLAVIHDLSHGDVKAQADIVIRVHGPIVGLWAESFALGMNDDQVLACSQWLQWSHGTWKSHKFDEPHG